MEQQGQWCDNCLQDIRDYRVIKPYTHGLHALDGCQVLYNYKAGLKRVIHDLKFRSERKYSCHLGWLLQQGAYQVCEQNIDGVVPVPLDEQRFAERGFNQTELIFKPWSKNSGLIWLDCLKRSRPTKAQWGLNAEERVTNLQGAFAVGGRTQLVGKKLLLVDDIFTTGCTMEECARELKKAGADLVKGFALASGAR